MRSLLVCLLFASCSAQEGPGPAATPNTEAPSPPSPSPSESAAKTPEPAVAPEPTAAVQSPASTAAHAHVQQVMHGEALAAHPNVHFAPIEDPSGKAMHRFHAALRALAAGDDPDGKVRVAFYGASSVAADRYTGYLRGYLQQRFGDGGVGFLALVPLWRWHRHDSARVTASKHWRIEHGQRKTGKLDGHYGLLGASAHADHKRAWSSVAGKGSAVSSLSNSDRIELHYLLQPGGGSFEVKLGKAAAQRFATAGETPQAHQVALDVPESFLPLRVELNGDGEVRLFGASFEREQPGVVVDALGIGGTRSANMVAWNEAPWAEALERRDPSLYVLAYGANESVDDDEPIEIYRRDLEAVLDRFAAAAPQASCVLVGPVDYPLKNEETEAWEVRPRLRQILEIQRETAAARGCGFFDTSRLTGGLGSMSDWVQADPQLAKNDHLHLSPLGYLHFGRVLSDALMADFDGVPRAPDPSK